MPKVITQEEAGRREAEIMEAGLRVIEADGFSALTMDRVVAEVSYSKGTVYNSFAGKEDLFVAIRNLGRRIMADYSRRADAFAGSPRERFIAQVFAYSFYARRHPILFRCDVSTRGPLVLEKASRERLDEGRRLERQLHQTYLGPIEDGIRAGDLALPRGRRALDVASGTFYLELGCISLFMLSEESEMREYEQAIGRRPDLDDELCRHLNVYLDGWQWRELSSERNYARVWKTFPGKIFAREIAADRKSEKTRRTSRSKS